MEEHRGPLEAKAGKRFTWRWYKNGCAVWDSDGELGGTLEPVCLTSTPFQASRIVKALNAANEREE